MNEEDPDLLAGDNLDRLRGREPYPAMSERFRLTEELENARYENNLLAQKCRELEKEGFHLAANQCHSGYAGEHGHHRCGEIDRLTKERDEARREVCGFHHLTGFLGGDYAISRGWDCYENYSGEGFPQSVKDFKEFLKGQDQIWLDRVDRLTKERDEARRKICEIESQCICDPPRSPQKYASLMGWDCFKENTMTNELTSREQVLYDRGYRICGLCGCWDYPVNHHNDCLICSRAQYGDE